MFYKGRFHQFYHHSQTGDPYLGLVHKEATEYKIPKDDSTTDDRADTQLALQICHLLVIIDKDQPGSLEKAKNREP